MEVEPGVGQKLSVGVVGMFAVEVKSGHSGLDIDIDVGKQEALEAVVLLSCK